MKIEAIEQLNIGIYLVTIRRDVKSINEAAITMPGDSTEEVVSYKSDPDNILAAAGRSLRGKSAVEIFERLKTIPGIKSIEIRDTDGDGFNASDLKS